MKHAPWQPRIATLIILVLLILGTTAVQAAIPASERTVLLNLYTGTNGGTWTTSTNWNGPAGTECTWYGVTCDAGQTAVTGIDLHSNNLNGTLPSDLNNLTNLTSFAAYTNHLTGSIPALTGLTNLVGFVVYSNQLTGSIPALAGLTNLQTFAVNFNQLTGSIPALTGLTSFQYFTVGGNHLTGSIPSLTGLTNLGFFSVSDNQLSGSIPALTGLTNLQYFFVNNNQLTGNVPSVPTPNNLNDGSSSLCPNFLNHTPDPAWDAATGQTPWYTDCPGPARLIVPDGTSLQQTFSAYPETRWFTMTVEPGKTYVIEAVDPSGDLTANAIGTLSVFAPDGISAPPEANVDCTAANGPRPPAVDVNSDGIRCVLRTALPNGTLLNKRPVYVKVTRFDPALGGGAQFKIRAREATIYGRWLTLGNDFHVEVENTTGDATCVEVTRYPATGLTYTPGPGWSGTLASFTMTVPAFGAVKQVIPSGSLVGTDSEGALRIGACASPTNLLAAGLHVSTYAFDPLAARYIYFFTSTANDGKTRSTW